MTDQKMAALKKANHTRLAQSKLRRTISELTTANGARMIIALLTTDIDDIYQSMPIDGLVGSIRGVGAQKIGGILRDTGLRNYRRPIGDLTTRQKELIVNELKELI